MAFYARCITTPFPSLLNTSPRSTLRLFRNKSQSSSLSLSLSTPIRTNGSLFLTVRQPGANAKARERNASPFTRRSSPWEWEQWERGERGGPPFDTIHRKRQKEGNGGAIGGRLCRADRQLSFSFLSRISLIISGREGGALDEFFRIFREIIFQLHDTSKYSLEGLNNAFTWLERSRDRLYISSKQLFSSVRNDLENETFSEKRCTRYR